MGEVAELVGERGLVGHHPHGVVVEMHPVGGGLHHHAPGPVRQHPVQGGGAVVGAKGQVAQVDLIQPPGRLLHRGALPQQIGDELKHRHVLPAVPGLGIYGAGGKVQGRHTQPLLVHSIVVERIPLHHRGHPYHTVSAAE